MGRAGKRRIFWPAAAVLAMALLSSGGARAMSDVNYCIDKCIMLFNCQGKAARGDSDTGCTGDEAKCISDCSENAAPAPPPVTGAYGAIAYDKNSGAWGMSGRSQSRKSAKKSALAYCEKRGADCRVVESFSNTCAAVATSTGGDLGWGTDDDAKEAGAEAIKHCNRKSGSERCFIQLWNCYAD